MPKTERRVVASSDVTLAVFERGDASRPTVVLVHGYPDTSAVWDGVAERLAERFHVVTYDVRGAGASSVPRATRDYRLELLVEDLAAVVDATSPSRPVHLVGHDWGSIQSWEAVTTERLRGRVASFTSMSGPCLDHAAREIGEGSLAATLGQLARSTYVGLFHLPLAPSVVRALGGTWPAFLEHVERVPPEAQNVPATHADDAAHGISLYRANFVDRFLRPRERVAHCPVQLLVARRDRFVGPAVMEAEAKHVDRLYRRDVALGHWWVLARPDLVARHVAELVDHVEGAPARPALRRALRRREGFTGRLVVVTGAASGIGRATALAFAARGADVVLADLDRAGAERAADEARAFGVEAHAHGLDVADEPAFARFAAEVIAELGVPDVLVSNAGIGVAGRLLDTSAAEWERLLRVNLSGVAHGARLFGAAMREAAVPGHIVNVASAAAFTPSRALPAYSATKAAVKMLSECLRAELAGDGIGVSAICPGFVDTNIPLATRFAGADAADEERRRRAAKAAYARRNLRPEAVAAAILRAVERDEAIVPVGVEAHALEAIGRFFPGVARAVARLDPDAPVRAAAGAPSREPAAAVPAAPSASERS